MSIRIPLGEVGALLDGFTIRPCDCRATDAMATFEASCTLVDGEIEDIVLDFAGTRQTLPYDGEARTEWQAFISSHFADEIEEGLTDAIRSGDVSLPYARDVHSDHPARGLGLGAR